MQSTLLSRFKFIAYAEGISFLLLLGVAMPLKYMFDMPGAVKYTGWVHGVLFVAYCFMLILVWQDHKWKTSKVFIALLAALLPFGPFIFNKKFVTT